VAKNVAIPTAAGLVNKLLDAAFLVILARSLGPTDLGRYTWAVLVVGYFDILVNFGLGILVTREVARDRGAASRYLGGALIARVSLWLASLAISLLIAGPLASPLGLTFEMSLALVVLTVGIGISNLAGICSALFSAHERMEYPAAVTVLTTVLKVLLGICALLLGYGYVGLAVVSVIVNLLSGAVLLFLLAAVLGRPRPIVDRGFAARLAVISYPLMINNLLATLFFRVDGLILRAAAGDTVLGWYGMAYRFVDALNIVPTSITLALFPILSRMAGDRRQVSLDGAGDGAGDGAATRDAAGAIARSEPAPDRLLETTTLACKALLCLALPIAVGTTLLADPLVRIVAGQDYLPHSAIALQVLIWFLPISFTNGLLQYVLIATNQQTFITRSFVVATLFNVTANLLLVPHWSYLAAATTTILSELVLLAPFWFAISRSVGPLPLLTLAWRPALAAMAMAPPVWLLREPAALLAVPAGLCVYTGVLLAIGGVSRSERETLRTALGQLGGRIPWADQGGSGRDKT